MLLSNNFSLSHTHTIPNDEGLVVFYSRLSFIFNFQRLYLYIVPQDVVTNGTSSLFTPDIGGILDIVEEGEEGGLSGIMSEEENDLSLAGDDDFAPSSSGIFTRNDSEASASTSVRAGIRHSVVGSTSMLVKQSSQSRLGKRKSHLKGDARELRAWVMSLVEVRRYYKEKD